MANDAGLRRAIVWLEVIVKLVGIYTLSLKKMMITYAFGMVRIGGILLPNRDFFDRDFCRWFYLVTAEERAALLAGRSGLQRYRIYPMRVIITPQFMALGYTSGGLSYQVNQSGSAILYIIHTIRENLRRTRCELLYKPQPFY